MFYKRYRTVDAYHRPPCFVGIPCRFNSSAISRRVHPAFLQANICARIFCSSAFAIRAPSTRSKPWSRAVCFPMGLLMRQGRCGSFSYEVPLQLSKTSHHVQEKSPQAVAVLRVCPPMSTRCKAIPALSQALVWCSASSASRKSRSSFRATTCLTFLRATSCKGLSPPGRVARGLAAETPSSRITSVWAVRETPP